MIENYVMLNFQLLVIYEIVETSFRNFVKTVDHLEAPFSTVPKLKKNITNSKYFTTSN